MNAQTEEEQIENLKRYIREYGSKILLVVLLSIASFFGYQGWQDKQRSAKETASVYYGELANLAAVSGEWTDEQAARFDDIFSRLAEEFPQSGYAAYAALHKARIEVVDKQLDDADATLSWVVDNCPYSDIKALAQLRLARVALAKGDVDRAQDLLNSDSGPYAPLYEHVRGDVLLEQGEQEKALLAYKKAKSLMGGKPASMAGSLLDMKIASLGDAGQGKVFSHGEQAADAE